MTKTEELEKLTEFEIRYLKTFEERIEAIYPHERLILKLIKKLNEFIEFPDVSIEKETIEAIKTIKKEITPKFKILNEESKEEELFRIERAKKKDLIDVENIAVRLYNGLIEAEKIEEGKENREKKKSRAYKKIRRSLLKLKTAIEEEERGITLNEHIFFMLNRLHSLKSALASAIKYEIQILDNAAEKVKKREIEGLEDIINLLKGLNKQIKSILRTEKSEVYKPLMDLIVKEVGGAEQFKKLKEKGKITLDDIKRDLFTMTDSNEILEYLKIIELNKELVEEGALLKLENYRIKAREIIKKQKSETLLDEVTKLFTRGAFDELLDTMIKINHLKERKGEKGETFALILLDIDHFKSVNDIFGHQEGDRVLRFVSRRIKETVRINDRVYKYGGEEIVVVLPRTEIETAIEIAERIRRTIQETDFKLQDRSITISGGVSVYGAGKDDDGITKEEIIEAADKRLYKAKKSGRNKIVPEPDR
ncbi:GGDEF domain-containing protein [Candidatus Woesearchaeota archaeon]|nr:GGDEF domain-containing protein [Candidatus Woesearchaeota archaeon]